MEFLTVLWMPIVVSAVLVWIASFLCHMVLPIHKGEWKAVPSEANAMEAMSGVPAGSYMFPFGSMQDMKNPEFIEKLKRGPCGLVVIWPGPVNMGRNLILTLISYLIIGVFVAYVVWHAFTGVAGSYLEVFRIAGATAFMAHGLGLIPHAIWYRNPRLWSVLLDAVIFAAVTAGSFAWLWHRL